MAQGGPNHHTTRSGPDGLGLGAVPRGVGGGAGGGLEGARVDGEEMAGNTVPGPRSSGPNRRGGHVLLFRLAPRVSRRHLHPRPSCVFVRGPGLDGHGAQQWRYVCFENPVFWCPAMAVRFSDGDEPDCRCCLGGSQADLRRGGPRRSRVRVNKKEKNACWRVLRPHWPPLAPTGPHRSTVRVG
jgi:hypothetical protein